MALFQKKPQASDSMPLYTLGLQRTVIVVGLGNPGKEYEYTRHNVGFLCVDEFVKQQGMQDWIVKKDLKCLQSTGTIGSTRVIAIKPTTFMNNSGEAVQAVLHFYKLTPKDVVVVHDELDIDFGQIRSRFGGSDAGHNGIKSLINHIGADFNRLRVGIGPKKADKQDSAQFVLESFSATEKTHIPAMTREVNALLTEFIAGGSLEHETRNYLV